MTQQVTTLRTLKNLDEMSLEELVGILKVHELKLLRDGSIKKGEEYRAQIHQEDTHQSS